MKISKIFTSLVETQKNINENLVKLNKNIEEMVKPKLEKIDFDISKYATISNCFEEFKSNVETNIYTKEQTLETINKEYDYRKEYEKCKESNTALLEMIEQYFKYKDKYEVIQLFNKIDSKYIVDRQINNT
jgi:hypothetical protein